MQEEKWIMLWSWEAFKTKIEGELKTLTKKMFVSNCFQFP